MSLLANSRFSLDSDDGVVSCAQDGEVVEKGAHSDVADAVLHVQLVHLERLQRRHVQFGDSCNESRVVSGVRNKESANTPAGSFFLSLCHGFKVAAIIIELLGRCILCVSVLCDWRGGALGERAGKTAIR